MRARVKDQCLHKQISQIFKDGACQYTCTCMISTPTARGISLMYMIHVSIIPG